MSSATASLRGGAPLPPDMKDLLNKLVAADEGSVTCPAVQFQRCDGIDGVTVECTGNTSCNFVSLRFVGNNPGATQAGKYCQRNTLEDELVEESTELQDNPHQCQLLGSDDGGCVPPGITGLYCKPGFTCVGYAPPTGGLQNPTLGACKNDATRAVDNRSPATICHQDFYGINIPCSNNGACRGNWVNPNNCEARCVGATATEQGVCASPTFEEEEEDLAAAADAGTPIDEAHCLITTEDTQPSCTLNANGSEIPTQGKLCCGKDADGNLFRGDGVSCNYYGNHVNSVRNSDSGPGAYCVYAPGEDLAVN